MSGMRWRVIAFVLIAGSAVSIATVRQDTLKAVLQHRYDDFSRAVASKDTRFFEAYFPQNFTVVLPNKEVKNRDDVLRGFSDLTHSTAKVKWVSKIAELHVGADGVVALVQGHVSARIKGEDKKTHRVEIDGVNEDTWTQVGVRWQVKRVEILKADVKVDGKPAPMPPGLGVGG